MSCSRRCLLSAAAAMLPRPGAALSARFAGPQPGDAFVASDDVAHALLRPESLVAGAAPVLAWPVQCATQVVRNGLQSSLVLLLRLRSGEMVAFSAICQHAGCVVSGWLAPEHLLLCPCHGSRYDPARGGAVAAGPAPLPLPALPVGVVDDVVRVVGDFSAPVGGHTSRTD